MANYRTAYWLNCRMSRLAPQQDVLRELFALSGNQCAFPGCTHALISDKGTFIAQLCHIEAANKGGQRYKDDQTDEERRSKANLLLLCYAHHRETDDEDEYTVERLKKIKKDHEDQFKNQYHLPEIFVDKVLGSIEASLNQISRLSENTNIMVQGLDEKMNELLRRTPSQASIDDEKHFDSQIDFIKDLKNRGNSKTAIEKLIEFKVKNWHKITEKLKYKVLANLGMFYLGIHDGLNAGKYFMELNDVDYETAESLGILCLGYAISGKTQEFDICFQRALNKGPEDINLWVGYVQRYKKIKSADQLLKELPATISETNPILFSIGGIFIEEGRKKEGITLLKRTLEKNDHSIEKKSDITALIATRIIQDIVDPIKFAYDNYSEEELEELREAKTLLTEAWDNIVDTEMAAFKWHIILNRGVINKLIRLNNQALLDFQKAFDLSKEFLAFKNLLMMYIQTDNLSMAQQLLNDPGIRTTLNEEELFEMQTFKARLLSLMGYFRDGISLLVGELKEPDEKRYAETVIKIISTYFEYGELDDAIPWCEKLIHKFPSMIAGYLFFGFFWTKKSDTERAFEFYKKASNLLIDTTPQNEIFELATGYMDLNQYEKAIPLFEQLANKKKLNSFSRGLIHAYYQFGDLQAALAIAENLFFQFPEQPFLAEIISNIYQETKQYDSAIQIIEIFLPYARNSMIDFFSFRMARLYSMKRDWDNVRSYALKITEPNKFDLDDSFILASLFLRSRESNKAAETALDARFRFFDESLAHLKYIQVCIEMEKDERDMFPLVVRVDSAVIIKTENEEEKTFLITDKNIKGENVLKTNDSFSQQLINKSKNEEVLINKGFGFSYSIVIIDILDIYTYAFRESMHFFETRFAGQQNVGVFHANPGQPDDQLEQFIKQSSFERNSFERQLDNLYNQRKATIGILARFHKRNCVMQWFALLSSQNVSLISFSRNEYPAVENAVNNNVPLILDLTALLTMFFISKENNFFFSLSNKLIVSQSTINEVQSCYEELENGAEDGIFTMNYEQGHLVGHTTPKEIIKEHREILQKIIDWCKEHTRITTSEKPLQLKRDERKLMSDTLDDCFYDAMLLAEEFNAAIVSDDDNFKNLLRSDNYIAPFSTYQLALYLVGTEKILATNFDLFRMQLISANYIYIPVSAEQLWQAFDNTHFKIGKPFTVATKGLIVMRPESSAAIFAQFLKRLYLESGLATTRQQTTLFILSEISKRNDFPIYKKLLNVAVRNEFKLLANFKEDILQLIKAF